MSSLEDIIDMPIRLTQEDTIGSVGRFSRRFLAPSARRLGC